MLNPSEFFFQVPLYHEIEITDANIGDFYKLMLQTKTVDGYSIKLNENTTYSIRVVRSVLPGGTVDIHHFSGYGEITLTCARTAETMQYYYLLRIEEKEELDEEVGSSIWRYYFQKVGQFPSLADLQIKEIKNYKAVFDQKWMKEITKAIGLVAHGVGIGSFVYLRRVFERLIEEAHIVANSESSWDESAYKGARFLKKIEMLKQFLPQFLIDNKEAYSILSKGIHELEEQECLQHFPVLLATINFILEEKLEKRNKAKKMEEVQNAINDIHKGLKSIDNKIPVSKNKPG
jgi:hypothetical protein